MLALKTSYGLPIDMIGSLSPLSMVEWYVNRRYKNPLQNLDFLHKADPIELDSLLQTILQSDHSIYKLSPALNICKMLGVYKQQHMTFPIYVYSEKEEPYILEDCKELFPGIKIQYFHGDLETAIKKCDQNFTYIFSDLELVKKASSCLTGTCSHILLAREYRYNYLGDCVTFKCDLQNLAKSHPFVRIGTTRAMDWNQVALSFTNIAITQGGKKNATSQCFETY